MKCKIELLSLIVWGNCSKIPENISMRIWTLIFSNVWIFLSASQEIWSYADAHHKVWRLGKVGGFHHTFTKLFTSSHKHSNFCIFNRENELWKKPASLSFLLYKNYFYEFLLFFMISSESGWGFAGKWGIRGLVVTINLEQGGHFIWPSGQVSKNVIHNLNKQKSWHIEMLWN